MKKSLLTTAFVFALLCQLNAQTKEDSAKPAPVWTEADKKYLLENLVRSKEELINETKNLSKKQWNFRESADRWNINQVVEHLAIWELLFMREISVAYQGGPVPEFTHYISDSLFFDADPQGLKKNNALEYTKPFSYAIPLGNNEGPNNVIWLTAMRNESIDFVKKETGNMRIHYVCFGPNVHQNLIMISRHTDKHLRQIRKVKEHPNYPKK
jgi:hypothetical protein